MGIYENFFVIAVLGTAIMEMVVVRWVKNKILRHNEENHFPGKGVQGDWDLDPQENRKVAQVAIYLLRVIWFLVLGGVAQALGIL